MINIEGRVIHWDIIQWHRRHWMCRLLLIHKYVLVNDDDDDSFE